MKATQIGLLALTLAFADSAAAYTASCGNYEYYDGQVPPECMEGGGVGAVHVRWPDVCDTGGASPIGVELVHSDVSQLGVGQQLTATVLMHGGGAHSGFVEALKATPPHDGHYTNPYQNLARNLAVAGGLAVFLPIISTSTGQPTTEVNNLADALRCAAERVDLSVCGHDGYLPCYTDLAGRVAWTANDMSRLVVVGHSSGGVISLYLPQTVGSALKGLILIDPSKDYQAQPTPQELDSGVPLVHLYPDYYGPLNHSANNLFELGDSSYFTGPWVPIGLRDYSADEPCDPDEGCHVAHHCTSLVGTVAWNYPQATTTDSSYCAVDVLGCPATSDQCSGSPNYPADGCCPSGEFCGQFTKCTRNSALRPSGTLAHAWTWGGAFAKSETILKRYVVGYAGCLGGYAGIKMQSWVNGWHRIRDDDGVASELCTNNGFSDPFGCGSYNDEPTCTANDCLWAKALDGKVVRINNGGPVKEYDPDPERFYTSAEGYSASGVCVGGPHDGHNCTSDDFCGEGNNCTAGDITERQERLSSVVTSAYFIGCQSGP